MTRYATAIIAGQTRGEYATLQDALHVAATYVRNHVKTLSGIEHLSHMAVGWEMLADQLEEAALRGWDQREVEIWDDTPDGHIWGARWN